MTRTEAFEAVEMALGNLQLGDKFGPYELPLMALPAVAKFHGKDWEVLVNKMYEEEITPDEYARQAVQMVREYGVYRNNLRLERKLLEIREVHNARKI